MRQRGFALSVLFGSFLGTFFGHALAADGQMTLNEGVDLIKGFKSLASALHMDVWWLTILTFWFVWSVRRFLSFVKVDIKNPPRLFEVLSLEAGWWPALRDFVWGVVAILFAYVASAIALWLAPQSLPDIPWIVFGPVYGLGAIVLYLILKRVGKRVAWIRERLKAD